MLHYSLEDLHFCPELWKMTLTLAVVIAVFGLNSKNIYLIINTENLPCVGQCEETEAPRSKVIPQAESEPWSELRWLHSEACDAFQHSWLWIRKKMKPASLNWLQEKSLKEHGISWPETFCPHVHWIAKLRIGPLAENMC